MTEEQLSERISEIILDIDKMDGRSLYDAKQKLRQLERDVAAELRTLREDRENLQAQMGVQMAEELAALGQGSQ
ncbi:hypothetical protein [Ruegeria atlantica]|uniref:hypothetical protein n=1 Tax=Ruegeria atlantica TaxID=81569 RepID=UPI00147EA3DA|nr:hypothetical protein [Ruegeria atlantica]